RRAHRGVRAGAHGGAPRQDRGGVHRPGEGGDVPGGDPGRPRGPPRRAADRGPRERDLGRLRADDDRGPGEGPQGGRPGGGAGDARGAGGARLSAPPGPPGPAGRPDAGGGGVADRGPQGGRRMNREIAWRVFAGEFNDANKEVSDGGERSPSYLVTPLGAKINRLFVVGVLTDVENVATDEAPMWRARLQDPTGTYHVYAGQYQPEAAAALAKLKPPAFVAVTGKSRLFAPDSGGTYTSIRPEGVKVVNEALRDYWILDACRSLKRRLEALREAYKMDPVKKEELAALGVKPPMAEGIVAAVEHYGK